MCGNGVKIKSFFVQEYDLKYINYFYNKFNVNVFGMYTNDLIDLLEENKLLKNEDQMKRWVYFLKPKIEEYDLKYKKLHNVKSKLKPWFFIENKKILKYIEASFEYDNDFIFHNFEDNLFEYSNMLLQKIFVLRDRLLKEKVAMLEDNVTQNGSLYWDLNKYIASERDVSHDIIRAIDLLIDDEKEKYKMFFCYKFGYKVELDSKKAMEIGKVGNYFARYMIQRLQSNMLLAPEDMSIVLSKNISKDSKYYNYLMQHFTDPKGLCRFLDKITEHGKNVKRGLSFWARILFPPIYKNCFNDYVANNESPYRRDELINHISTHYDYNSCISERLFDRVNGDFFEERYGGYIPKNVKKRYAIAHILLYHPEGLNFKDMIRLTSESGIAMGEFEDGASRISATLHNEYIFLSSKARESKYKHIKFLSTDKDLMDLMIDKLKQLLDEAQSQISLVDFFNEIKDEHLDYYEFRHWVKDHGAGKGVYFNGKSGVDAVSSFEIEKIEINQHKQVHHFIESQQGLIDKSLITDFVRSKNKNLAYHYINTMVSDKRLLKYNIELLCTPIYFFTYKISREIVKESFQSILSSTDKMIDVSIFCEHCNESWDKNFSVILFNSLLNYFKAEIGYQKQCSIVSKTVIKYDSVGHIVRDLYKEHQDKKIVRQEVKQIVLISKMALNRHMNRLRKQ